MAKREFLMLAHTYKKGSYASWFVSEKLDGMRAWWDGGITRGLLKADVPWANTENDYRYVSTPRATGLWSRYGHPIQAPKWWLDLMPRCPLDMELFMYRSGHQRLMSCVKQLHPDSHEWRMVHGHVLDMPSLESVLKPGLIDNPNFHKRLTSDALQWAWARSEKLDGFYDPNPDTQFIDRVAVMRDRLFTITDAQIDRTLRPTVCCHPQTQLPSNSYLAEQVIKDMLTKVEAVGGEGLVIRRYISVWRPKRTNDVLKIKPRSDMEGTVVGYITGRKTDKGSRLLGRMGALILRLDNGVRLELSGFTDQERELKADYMGEAAVAWAEENPECECPEGIEAVHFPRGSRVTFKYRTLSDDGVPVEAAYWRKR